MPTDNKKVLIIDDSKETRDVMLYILKRRGFLVEAARDIDEGIDIILQVKPDIIIFNITNSLVDGIELGLRLRKEPKARNIPIIFVSPRDETSLIIGQVPGATVEYIEKPCSARQLIEETNRLIAFAKTLPPATDD